MVQNHHYELFAVTLCLRTLTSTIVLIELSRCLRIYKAEYALVLEDLTAV